jgi:threonine aldolase
VTTTIDLFSDTKTRPTAAMRRAIAEAEVGDEQKFEDPTINRLRERVCALLGKEDAVFLPSGTMANEIAIAVHCQRGDEVLAERSSHIVNYEAGGPAALAGAMIQAIDGENGLFTASQVRRFIRPPNRYFPRTRLVCVEQTANAGGGRVWPLAQLREVAAAAHAAGLATHMDGARLFNAVVAAGVSAADFAAPFDSVWIDFSKGLGCPIGAMLAGSRGFIEEAWRLKQRWGGAMRQAGIVGAAALHALDHHVERLAEDHANAQLLAAELEAIAGIRIDPAAVQTNLVYFDLEEGRLSAPALVDACAARGVLLGAMDERRLRAVTHLDVDRAAVLRAAAVVRDILSG